MKKVNDMLKYEDFNNISSATRIIKGEFDKELICTITKSHYTITLYRNDKGLGSININQEEANKLKEHLDLYTNL